jgi:hypothetical protein
MPLVLQVFLNGMWIGIHRNPMELVRTLRSLRRAVSYCGTPSTRYVYQQRTQNVTHRHIRHTAKALPTGIVPAETQRWGLNPSPNRWFKPWLCTWQKLWTAHVWVFACVDIM